MLENYYPSGGVGNPSGVTREQKQRLIAVQAALEIAKASVSATSAITYSSRVRDDLNNVAEGVDKLADAIQEALKAAE